MFVTAGYELMTFDIESKYRVIRVYQDIVLIYNKGTHRWVDIKINKERFYKLMKKYDIHKFSQENYIYG